MGYPRLAPMLPESSRPDAGPATPGAGVAWTVLGGVGLTLFLVGSLDLLLTWYPTAFSNPEWEFGTISATLNGLPVPVLGLSLLAAAGLMNGQRWVVRTVSVLFFSIALAVVGAALLYATVVPVALGAVTDPMLRLGLLKAMGKTAAQAIAYPIFCVWVAAKVWYAVGPRPLERL